MCRISIPCPAIHATLVSSSEKVQQDHEHCTFQSLHGVRFPRRSGVRYPMGMIGIAGRFLFGL